MPPLKLQQLRTLMCVDPNPDLTDKPCDRHNLHNPHEWLETQGHPDGGQTSGHLYLCPGVWNISRSAAVDITVEPDPDSDMTSGDLLRDDINASGGQHSTDPPMAELIQWWVANASQTIASITGKIDEYGGRHTAALDLIDVGRLVARIAGRTVDDEEATELGIFFYLAGKLSRWAAAVGEGRRPSDDTLHDTAVYAQMAQRNRAVGGWPWPAQL
jgi:hypothetical protein